MSQAGRFSAGSGAQPIETITPDSGIIVVPTAGGNVDILGGNNITTVGTLNTLTIDLNGTTNHALKLGNASGSLTSLGVATNGQLPIGSTGADPVLATLTAGTNIAITNGAGSISIAANSGAQTINYVAITDAASPYTALATDYYISADSTAGVISVLLPNAPTTGRTFVIKDAAGTAATFNITVTTVGGVVNIDGATTFALNTAYESCTVVFGTSAYEIY